jgi:AcrR family transcriptional regulator
MDRRQRKTREAIFTAFTSLLAKKNYSQISVQEIIDLANIGRTTFYAHFETKDYLLRDLCEELFGHIIDTAMGQADNYHLICDCKEDTVFTHLLCHLKVNDRNIIELLTSQNNEIFLRYFKCNLKKLIITQYADKDLLNYNNLPKDYVINHIASCFVETVEWWLQNKTQESPEEITEYFLTTTRQFL